MTKGLQQQEENKELTKRFNEVQHFLYLKVFNGTDLQN